MQQKVDFRSRGPYASASGPTRPLPPAIQPKNRGAFMKRTRTRSELYVAVATAIGAGITLSAVSSAWAQQIAQSRERIEVTGTNIKRVDTETVAPVEIITRDQIERSGQATVGEMLRRIPSATAGSFNESSTNSFAPGAFGISLRGLGQKTTLVLLNGRRTASYGFAQNLQDTF